MEIPARAKKKSSTREGQFRYALDMCAKTGDLAGALALYESAVAENLRLSAYHFNSLLHIISTSIGTFDEPSKKSSIDTSFAIFDRMAADGATPTEATITSMARIAAQRPDEGANLAFDLVKTMGERYGASPRLRTYSPVLSAFCRRLEADKAYAVECHMVSMGVVPEEPEIAALLEVSAKVGREDKVYGYLHKLRGSVGCVADSTAEILEGWFRSERAMEVERSNWDAGTVKDAILMNGGGWHGLGWLGEGVWDIRHATVNSEGDCSGCGQRLACVDIDRMETEKFAVSVATLALGRESKSNFRTFQEWLEKHSEYEAIIDGANVGLYQQNFADGGFSLSQLDAVVQELFERSQGRWPLIVLHKKRALALMENPSNRQILEKWRAEGALYTTPTGSNDDWYWLYAAVKLKCLLVTNDEMRDHIFELLGRSFFPKWKERHQVRYTFNKGDLMLMMPPPYSSVIQESDTGSWHVPLDEKCDNEKLRNWLCITRPASLASSKGVCLAAGHSTQTSVEPRQMTSPAEDVNGEQKLPSSFQPCNDRAVCVTGKRKDRP